MQIQITTAEGINSANAALNEAVENAKRGIGGCVHAAKILGDKLIEARALMGHGEWLEWLRKNCPEVSDSRARRAQSIARLWEGSEAIQSADSLRSALSLCFESGDEEEKEKTDGWPKYLKTLGAVARVSRMIERLPLSRWPDEGKVELRDKLEPIARMVWPDKFHEL